MKRVLGSRSRDDLGPVTHPLFQPGSPINAKWGWHPLFSGTEDHHGECEGTWRWPPSSEGVCQAEPPTQAWRVHELQDTGRQIQPHQRVLRVPKGTKKERRAMTSPSLTIAGCSLELHCNFRNLFTQENQPSSVETLSIIPIYKTH